MEVFRQSIRSGHDVFSTRQRGREIAASAGLDEADQVRVATALSEVCRDTLAGKEMSTAVFEMDVADAVFSVRVTSFPSAAVSTSQGLLAAKRLMSSVTVETDDDESYTVVMSRKLPRPITANDVMRIRERVGANAVLTPLEELRTQNRQLLNTIEEVEAAREALVHLNTELEETNRGVMAMYAQLSDELDSTNQGVVALYSELDDKSRQIEAASDAKSRFLSSVSHELRGPVNSVLGLSRLLLDPLGGVSSGSQREQVRLIEASAAELLDLVTQLLDLAKAESGKLDPVWMPIDVRSMLADVVAASRPLAIGDVSILLATPSDPLTVVTDQGLLRQVVRNLLSNALAFTEAGAVEVRASTEASGDLLIEVSDSGIGVAPENIDRIFEEFFQVRNHLQSRRRGTGLGLPYSRRVVETLGGTLTASSSLDSGTVFHIRLRSPTATSYDPVDLSDDNTTGSNDIGRILLVDDDDGFRAILGEMLGPYAVSIAEASDGTSALRVIRGQEVDVVLLDFNMPDLTGEEVLTAMAADSKLSAVVVVVVTSLAVDDRLRSQTRLADAVVSKDDVTPDSLRRLISRLRVTPK